MLVPTTLVSPCPLDGFFSSLVQIARTAKHLDVAERMRAALRKRHNVVKFQSSNIPTVWAATASTITQSGEFGGCHATGSSFNACSAVGLTGVFVFGHSQSFQTLGRQFWVARSSSPICFSEFVGVVLPIRFVVGEHPIHVLRTPPVVRRRYLFNISVSVFLIVEIFPFAVTFVPPVCALGLGLSPCRIEAFFLIVFVVSKSFTFDAPSGTYMPLSHMEMPTRHTTEIT